MTCTCGKPTSGITCDECWREFCDRIEEERDRYDYDHDPAWHGNLAALTNAHEEDAHD